MKLRRASLILITLAGLIALSAIQADAFLYAGKRKRINCGVVWLRNAAGAYIPSQQPIEAGLDANGYPIPGIDGNVGELFYLLEMMTDMKPAGWTFENPYAPGSPSGGLQKSNINYWRVDLSSATDLSRMSVLYLPASGTVNLTIQDREKLREFVDGGGVLWIDNAPTSTSGTPLDLTDNFFIPGLKFKTSAGGGDYAVSRHHPLLSLPYWLTDQEISILGAKYGQYTCSPGYDPSGMGGWGSMSEQPSTFDVLYPIVNNGSAMDEAPSIAVNAYGSGRIVATSNYVGRGCYLNYPFNLASLKFAYNVVTWASSWTHLRKDPRHSGGSIDTVGGTKLLKFWSMPAPTTGAIHNAPVIYKNVVFYSSGSTLYALDLMPQEDLDQNGNPDDGWPDTPSDPAFDGQDLLWRKDFDGVISAPSIVTAQDPRDPNKSIEAVLVQTASGYVSLMAAFPSTPVFPPTGAPPEICNMQTEGFGSAAGPFPPLYVNGWIYAVGGDGRLCAKSCALENWVAADGNRKADTEWYLPSIDIQGNAEPRSGPSFGYLKNKASGATVGVVQWYAGRWSDAAGSGGTYEQNDHVYSAPVLVCNDRIQLEGHTADGMVFEARVTYRDGAISPFPVPKVEVANYPGFDNIKVTLTPNKQGHLTIDFGKTVPSDALIYATYGLVYDTFQTTGVRLQVAGRRHPLEPRSPSGSVSAVPVTNFAGVPAMGPDAMLYCGGRRSATGIGSSVYGLMNDGNTQSTRWIYHLYDQVTTDRLGGASLPPGLAAGLPGSICDSTGKTLSNPQVYSSPAYYQDKVYVTVSGSPGSGTFPTGSPGAALVCFKANSEFVIRVTESAGIDASGMPVKRAKKLVNEGTGQPMQVKVWQPNLFEQPGVVTVPPTMGSIPVRRDMIDYQRGTITFNNFDQLKLRGGPGNVMQTNTFSPSLPVWVYVDNVEVPVDFATWPAAKRVAPGIESPRGDSVDLSGWNNMLWYYPVPEHEGHPCSGISSSPVVIGSTVYFECNDGYVYAIPTETGVNDGGPIDSKLLIWEGQVETAGGASGSPENSPNLSMAASNGVLVVPTQRGLYAYTNSTTLIADGSRVVEMDGAGEVRWGIDSISWPVAKPASTNSPAPVTTGPINKPSRAKYLPSGDMLIVNSGANQVCKVDRTGTIAVEGIAPNYTRAMYDKFVDPRNLLTPGQPLSISSPTDALYWQEFEMQPGAGGAMQRIDHCMIADSGNHRIIDLVHRYKWDTERGQATELIVKPGQIDPSSGFVLPELNWVTATSTVSEKYTFDSIQLINRTDGLGQDIYAAVSNYRGSLQPPDDKLRTEGLGGAVFAICYRVGDPSAPGNAWNYADSLSGRITAACDRINYNGTVQPLACPRYVQVVDRQAGRFLLICDNYGVYEVGPLGPPVPLMGRWLSDEDYRDDLNRTIYDDDGQILTTQAHLGIPLVATSVQELPNGNWLITNGYSGSNTAGTATFSGEVFELSFPGGTSSTVEVNWSSPPVYEDAAGKWSQKLQNGYILQQPRSAQRQL